MSFRLMCFLQLFKQPLPKYQKYKELSYKQKYHTFKDLWFGSEVRILGNSALDPTQEDE